MTTYDLIAASSAELPVAVACDAFGVSRSAYYAHLREKAAPPSKRRQQARRLEHAIRTAFEEFRGTYGRPRLLRVLRARGFRIGANQLRKKMAQMGLQAKPRRKFKRTTDSNHGQSCAPNLLAQQFVVNEPNRVWCSDITYVRTWEGWLYVCVVVDLFARKVVGWHVADHMRAELVTKAFDVAVGRRSIGAGLIFHSDRGSQYVSRTLRARLDQARMRQSMSARGNCYDNAVVESFNDKLKQELIYRNVWPTKAEAENAIADYIERFYNPRRMHSTLGYLSPNEFERQHAARVAA